MPVHVMINGELYSYWKPTLVKSKAKAHKMAKRLRARGYKVRVRMEKMYGQPHYGLWARKK